MNIDKQIYPRNNRGVILILTLWMVTVLSLIAYSLAYEMRLEVRLTKLRKDNLVAYRLAKAGVAKAICDLKNDMVIERGEEGEIFDAEGDIWKKGEDKTNIEMNEGTYSVRIIDEDSLVNLNTAHPILMQEMVKLFIGEDEDEEAKKIAISIYDWRDGDTEPADGDPETEQKYYENLIADDFDMDRDDEDFRYSYRMKNDDYTTVEELLDVYGVYPELFYGFEPEERKIEILQERAESRDRDSIHRMTYADSEEEYSLDAEVEGLRDMFTVNSSGAVNINTAGLDVLTAMIATAENQAENPEDLAQAIIDYRRDGDDRDVDNDKAFRNVGELSHVDGLSGGIISRMRSIQRMTVVSRFFRIIAEGNFGGAHRTIEAVVSRNWETFNVDENDEDFDPDAYERVRRVEDDQHDRDVITVESPSVRIIQWRER